jgi:ligand-binding sensor domain-containing protein
LLSESGIYSFNAATGTIAPLQLTGLPAGQKFSAFYYEDQTMRFYIGGHNNMVCKCSFDGVSAASCSLLSTTSTPSLGSITQIHYSTNGNLWIGSTAGLFVIPGIASSAIMPIPAVKEGVMSLSEDHSGLVLAGTTTFLYVQLDNTKIFDPSSWYFIRTPGVIDDCTPTIN